MKKYLHILLLPLVTLLPWGCSHSEVDKKIDAEVQSQTQVHSIADTSTEFVKIINGSNSLSQTQKEQMLSLQQSVGGNLKQMREEEAKLKVVLFKSLVDPTVNGGEIARIKNRVLSLDHDKTNLMLNALDDAQKILGRRARDDERIYRALLLDRPERAGRDAID